MFSIPGVLGLIFLTYVRPQAFVAELHGIPLIHLVYLLAVVGFAIDLRTRLITVRTAPLTPIALLYFGWSFVTLVVSQPGKVGASTPLLVIVFALFFMTAQAVQSFRALRVVVIALCLISVFLSVVAIHQGLAPHGCFAFKGSPNGTFDGRYCEDQGECTAEGEPGVIYRCEKIGLFGTYSINDRVRWLGIIEDPNELAMCVSLCIPLLIGLYLLRPSTRSAIVLFIGATAFVVCVVFTKSRGGQLVFLSALGVYFVRRYGVRGAVLVGVLAAPILLFGGRSGSEAEESKMERLEALYVATQLIRMHPLLGVGYNQFNDYNTLTAHNSYALSGAELGLPGLALFIACLYQAMKSFFIVTRRYLPTGPARPAYVWAGALLAAQAGIMVGIFFLSFNVSGILWTFLGVCNGFQLAVLRHDPAIDFRLKRRDLTIITGITLCLATVMYAYSHHKVNGG